jgi:AraC-like DNA-binding protein
MTIYEQIQNAVDFIEGGLSERIVAEDAAQTAGMSLRSFNTWFRSITGFGFKEYLIRRRLAMSSGLLRRTDRTIIGIAFEAGYESHEAFTRAFKKEFGINPAEYRAGRQVLPTLGKVDLIEEMYMGVIKKRLPELRAYTFSGLAPDPETKAFRAMEAWMKTCPNPDAGWRVFGHNIDREGNMSFTPENEGYKVLVCGPDIKEGAGPDVETIAAGVFVVTGIEGPVGDGREGEWIGAGWRRMNDMITTKGYTMSSPGRWYEEHLEPSEPGHLRMDLYVEIEES